MSTNEEETTVKVAVDDEKRREIVGEMILHQLTSYSEALGIDSPQPLIDGVFMAICLHLDQMMVKRFDPESWKKFTDSHPAAPKDYSVMRKQAQSSLIADLVKMVGSTHRSIDSGELDDINAVDNVAAKQAASSALDDLINKNRTIN